MDKSLLEKYFSGAPCTKEELRLIEEQLDKAGQQQDTFFFEQWKASQGVMDKEESEMMWTNIESRIPVVKERRRPLHRIQLAMAAAAVIGVLLFSGWWLRYRSESSSVTAWEKISNPSKGIKYVRLDDGTQVWLNAHSELSYEKGYADKGRREIKLEGEAFFDVAPDPVRPFAVNTRQLRTTVLGTSFNIRAWPSSPQMQIALVSGKVRVTSSLTTDSTVLLPGEVMNYDSGSRRSLVLEQAVREDMVEWVKGKIVLDNTPLPEILHQLEHIYNVSILFDADKLGSIRLSGQFRRDNIGDVLKNVLFPLDLDCSYDNGKYSIYKKKKE